MNPTGFALLAAAIGSAFIAAPAGWFAYDLLAKPGIIRTQQELCEGEVTAAAAKATRDEQLRQFRIGEAVTQQFITQAQADADDRQAQRDLLETEIEQYAKDALDGGRVCALDAADLNLLGMRGEQGGAVSGGH